MLRSFKPVAFDPYGRRRRRPLMPRWLALLLLGIALGAGGVVLVQEQYLPPRLSAAEGEQLREALQRAEADAKRLHGELADTSKRLQAALAERAELGDKLAASEKAIGGLRSDLASAIASLPPDPRGGPVEVRAARFSADGGALAYDVVLSRGTGGGKPLSGVMQFVLAGQSAAGAERTISLEPIAITIDRFEGLRGKVPLPDGFRPRQATLNVLDRAEGRRLGMRVLNVQ